MKLEGEAQLLRRLRFAANDRQLLKACSNAFRKSARRMRSDIVKRARRRGILRTVYGRRSAGLSRKVKLGRVRKIPRNNLQANLTATGLIKIQETGGRFKPHTIRPKKAPRLVFVTHGRLVAARLVRHPGATHPKIPVFWPTVERAGPQLRQDVGEAIRAHLAAATRVA